METFTSAAKQLSEVSGYVKDTGNDDDDDDDNNDDFTSAAKQLSEGSDLKAGARRPIARPPSPGLPCWEDND